LKIVKVKFWRFLSMKSSLQIKKNVLLYFYIYSRKIQNYFEHSKKFRSKLKNPKKQNLIIGV